MFVLIDKGGQFMLNCMEIILNMFSCDAGSISNRIRFNSKKILRVEFIAACSCYEVPIFVAHDKN